MVFCGKGGWKAKLLSFSGRSVLIQSVSKKMHLIGWKRVTKPKRMGGLGLHSMKALKCNDVGLNLLGILCFMSFLL